MDQKNPIIVANWKMYKTDLDAKVYLQEFFELLPKTSARVLIAPPFTTIRDVVKSRQYIEVGAQNVHEESVGAFTGEISAMMLRSISASFVICGHSERRRLFNDTEERVHLKLKQILLNGLLPILCVGETVSEREAGQTEKVLTRQIESALFRLRPSNLILAYEPVWAIGTGKTATPEMAADVHGFCRDLLKKLWGDVKVPILYGGSVTPETATALAAKPEIDGALVGGASLDAAKFVQIIKGFTS
jgi:triosephosphate isomerase (TIM)